MPQHIAVITRTPARAPKPRAFVMPVVKPVPAPGPGKRVARPS
jgi:hypothetical protein